MKLTPEPLYESGKKEDKNRICLVCTKRKTYSYLYIVGEKHPIIPLCKECHINWNVCNYSILKKIKHPKLIFKIFLHFLNDMSKNWVSFADYYRFLSWGFRMKKLKKFMKKHTGRNSYE